MDIETRVKAAFTISDEEAEIARQEVRDAAVNQEAVDQMLEYSALLRQPGIKSALRQALRNGGDVEDLTQAAQKQRRLAIQREMAHELLAGVVQCSKPRGIHETIKAFY